MNANRLDPYQARNWAGADLDPKMLTLRSTDGPRSAVGNVASLTTETDWPRSAVGNVACLTTDVCLTAVPGVASSISARSHTFLEIDHEIISTVILLPSAKSLKKGCCQLQVKYWSTACSSLHRNKCG